MSEFSMLHRGKWHTFFLLFVVTTSCQCNREMCLLWVSSDRMNTIKKYWYRSSSWFFIFLSYFHHCNLTDIVCLFFRLDSTSLSKIIYQCSQFVLWMGMWSNVPSTTLIHKDKKKKKKLPLHTINNIFLLERAKV